MMMLARKNVPLEWTEGCQHLFETLKKKSMKALVLVFQNLDKPYIMYIDDSYYCTGAVISQENETEGKIQERPITYVAYHILPM